MTFHFAEICPDCGNQRSLCSDPERVSYPQRAYCYVKAAMELTWRRTSAKYGHPEHADTNPHATDGLKWWMSEHDLTPDDHFI